MIAALKNLLARWKIYRLQKKVTATRQAITEEKRLLKGSRKLSSLNIYQLQRIVRRQPEARAVAEAELSRRLLRPLIPHRSDFASGTLAARS